MKGRAVMRGTVVFIVGSGQYLWRTGVVSSMVPYFVTVVELQLNCKRSPPWVWGLYGMVAKDN